MGLRRNAFPRQFVSALGSRESAKPVEPVDRFVSLYRGGEKTRCLLWLRCSAPTSNVAPSNVATSTSSFGGSGGYAQIGMAAPNNGMATTSELNAAYSTGMQAYLNAANAALSNPNAFQTYGSNSMPSSPPAINMDQSVYSPGDLAQAFGNSLLQSGELPNPSVWVPQSQELYDAAAGRFWGGMQLVGGAAEAVSGLAIGTAGTATEAGSIGATTPVSVPAMVWGAALAANGADNMWAGLQSLWSGQPTETYTQQAITAVTGSPTAGLWGNVAIGMAGGNWEEAGALASIDELTVAPYGRLSQDTSIVGQAHHLNQAAAYSDTIPYYQGLAIKLPGNIFTETGAPHTLAHAYLEDNFWQPFRDAYLVPTNLQYTRALQQSLRAAGLSELQVQQAVRSAIQERVNFGLLGGMNVPNVPRSISNLAR